MMSVSHMQKYLVGPHQIRDWILVKFFPAGARRTKGLPGGPRASPRRPTASWRPWVSYEIQGLLGGPRASKEARALLEGPGKRPEGRPEGLFLTSAMIARAASVKNLLGTLASLTLCPGSPGLPSSSSLGPLSIHHLVRPYMALKWIIRILEGPRKV